MTSSTTPTFNQWLDANGYDAKQWTPELKRALRARYEAQKPRPKPAEVLIAPITCQWPARCYRVAV